MPVTSADIVASIHHHQNRDKRAVDNSEWEISPIRSDQLQIFSKKPIVMAELIILANWPITQAGCLSNPACWQNNPLGSGAFKLIKHVPNHYSRYQRISPDPKPYPRFIPPPFTQINLIYYRGTQSAIEDLRKKQLDIMPLHYQEQWLKLSSNHQGLILDSKPKPSDFPAYIFGYFFNLESPIFRNRFNRKLFNDYFHFQSWDLNLFGKKMIKTENLILPLPGSNSPKSTTKKEFLITNKSVKIDTLLNQIAQHHSARRPFRILIPNSYLEKSALLLAYNLQLKGIHTKVEKVSNHDYLSRLNESSYDLIYLRLPSLLHDKDIQTVLNPNITTYYSPISKKLPKHLFPLSQQLSHQQSHEQHIIIREKLRKQLFDHHGFIPLWTDQNSKLAYWLEPVKPSLLPHQWLL